MSFGPATSKWLAALSASTRATYKPGLERFQDYLKTQNLYPAITESDSFLKAVSEDSRLEFLDQRLLDRDLMKGFKENLLSNNKTLTAKTIRTYIGAIQSLGAFWKIPISTEYAELPPAIVTYEKYPWNLNQVGNFLKSMDNDLYRCLGVWYLQSGLSNWDLLNLTYGKIKDQFEKGISPLCLKLVRHKTQRFEVLFRTFIGKLGLELFMEYLPTLGTLTDDTRLFPVTDAAVEGYFARRAKAFLPDGFKGRNPCCPSSLRTGFRTFLSDAKCPESIIEYFMGHNLTQDLRKAYTNKSDDSWRETYREYELKLSPKF